MSTDTVTWADDTLEGLMDFREHTAKVSPGFGMVYQVDGEWCWMVSHGPSWFRKRMHPQRNPDGLGVDAVFAQATRGEDLRGLRELNNTGITPLGWMFCAAGWLLEVRNADLTVRPSEHEDRRRVYTSAYLDHQTGALTTHLHHDDEQVQIVNEPMPECGWQAGNRRRIVSTMDLFRLATLGQRPYA